MQIQALVALLSCVAAAAAQTFDMDITRLRAPTKADVDAVAEKYGHGKHGGTAPLTNGGLGNYFYANLTLPGNAPQSVCFDTGSSDTWVIGATCHADSLGGCVPGEPGSTVVNKHFTATGLQAQTLYGDGSYGVNYTIYNTSVSYGAATAQNLPVGVATYLFGGVGGTGVLGMGWNDISNIAFELDAAAGINSTTIPVHNANFLDHLGLSLFGIFISPNDSVTGKVNFGYLDEKKYSTTDKFQWFNVTSYTDQYGVHPNGWWQFNGSKMEITYNDGKKTHKLSYAKYASEVSPPLSIADSGTPELVLTTDASNIINTWFNSSYNENDGLIPCTGTALNLSITNDLNKETVTYTIPRQLLALPNDAVTCYSLVNGGAESLGFTIFGAPFFQTVYSAFDKKNNQKDFPSIFIDKMADSNSVNNSICDLKSPLTRKKSVIAASQINTLISDVVAETRLLLGFVETAASYGFMKGMASEPLAKQIQTCATTISKLETIIPTYEEQIRVWVLDVEKIAKDIAATIVPESNSSSGGNDGGGGRFGRRRPISLVSMSGSSLPKPENTTELTENLKTAIARVLTKLFETLIKMTANEDSNSPKKINLKELDDLVRQIGPATFTDSRSSIDCSSKKNSAISRKITALARPKSFVDGAKSFESGINESNLRNSLHLPLGYSSLASNSSSDQPILAQKDLNESKMGLNNLNTNNSNSPLAQSPSLVSQEKNSAANNSHFSNIDLETMDLKPKIRSKSLTPADMAVLLISDTPPLPTKKAILNKQFKQDFHVSTPEGSRPNSKPASRAASNASIAAALFGDATTPIVDAVVLKPKQTALFFNQNDSEKREKLEANLANCTMRVLMKVSKRRIFEVDLKKWVSDNSITLRDFRDEYKRTEIMEILPTPKNPNVFSVIGHTIMFSNLLPVGSIFIESPYKINIYTESRGNILSGKPLYSLVGEIGNGRFMIIGRDKNSRAQINVGASSGWISKKKLVLLRDENVQCSLEIDDKILNDLLDVDKPSQEEVSRHRMEEIEKNTVTRYSQLLMAGIVVALAPKDLE
ncbi:hypothetical protein HK100_010871 [Physocladia obscura]|uniref:Peptidase A1 domain-containing protein n=1 Tax=Physocladia obscura TaxID=109957 RepID=A0AAD5T2X6_9FUNG|nr:hypothetical protein HK100_010871 [Physocladia obscura]